MPTVAALSSHGALLSIKMVYLLYFAGQAGVVSFYSLYFTELGLSGAQVGTLLAAGPLVGLIAQPLWSLWADKRLGTRGGLLLTTCGTVLIVLLFPVARIYWQLLALIVVWAFFFTAIEPMLNAVALHALGSRSDAFGRVRLYGSLGSSFSQVAAGAIMQAVYTACIFYWKAGFLLMCLPFLLRLPESSEKARRSATFRGSFRALCSNRSLLWFLAAALMLQVTQVMGWSYFALYARALGGTPVHAGAGLWIAICSAMIFFYYSEPLLRRFGADRLLAMSTLAYTTRWLLLSWAPNLAVALVVQALNGLCYAVYFTGAVAFVHRETPEGLRTTSQGVLSAVHVSLATIVGSLMGGFILDHLDVFWLYRVGAMLALLSFVPFFVSQGPFVHGQTGSPASHHDA